MLWLWVNLKKRSRLVGAGFVKVGIVLEYFTCMDNFVGEEGRSDRVELLKLILAELDDNGPVTANLNRLVTETLLAK